MSEHGKYQRNRYFYGRLLTSDDFITEQTYFMEKHRLHNRYLHGCGVVEGFDVSIDECNNILVEPGSAIDCAGNLVVVDSRVQLGVPSGAGELCIVVEYRERPTEEVPALYISSETDTAGGFSRILEEYCVSITDVNPNANHSAIRQDTYGCGISHPTCIARIQHGPKGWVLIQCGQRAAKHPLHGSVPGKTNG